MASSIAQKATDARIMEACGCNRVADYFAPGPYPPLFSTDPAVATVLWEWLLEEDFRIAPFAETGIVVARRWGVGISHHHMTPAVTGTGPSWMAALADAANAIAERTGLDFYKFPAIPKGKTCS